MTRSERSSARPKPRVSLGEGLGGHDNALGLIRLVLAAAVIVSHAFPLAGLGEDPLLTLSHGQANIGGVAVLGFFAISGYLITKSGARSDIVQYLWHRFLRIFPAFWAVLLVAAVIVGPVVWMLDGHPLASYAHTGPGSPVSYLTANWTLTMGQWGIYDIFASTTPYGHAAGSVFNGSLWTLAYEWTCYLIIGVLVLFTLLKHARILVPILTGIALVLQILHLVTPGTLAAVSPYFADEYHISLPLIFLFGACLAVYSKAIPLDDRLGILCAVVVVVTLFTTGLTILGYPALAYVVLWAAARLPKRLRRIGAVNDYSYGTYVYGFLVEQVLAYAGLYRFGYLAFVVAALVVTAGCAWLSWHVVEKPALAIKGRGPGRGVRYWWQRVRRAVPAARPSAPPVPPTAPPPPTPTSEAKESSS